MPKLTEETQLAKVMQAIIALQHIVRGEDKAVACQEAGISTWQFDKWISEGGPVIEEFQKSIVEVERIRMVQLAQAESVLLQQLIQAATVGVYTDTLVTDDGEEKSVVIYRDTKVSDQLKVLKYIHGLTQELEGKHGVQTKTDLAEAYLTGPNTHVEDSKMLEQHEMSRSSVSIKPQKDGSVNIHFNRLVEQIEGKATDPPLEQSSTDESDLTE